MNCNLSSKLCVVFLINIKGSIILCGKKQLKFRFVFFLKLRCTTKTETVIIQRKKTRYTDIDKTGSPEK